MRRPILFFLAPTAAGAIALLLLGVGPAGATPAHHSAACRLSARTTVVATHRSRTSAVRIERITVPSKAPAACRREARGLRARAARLGKSLRPGDLAFRQNFSCEAAQGIRVNGNTITLHGVAYVFDCVGAAECAQTADLQEESPTDPGVWFTVEPGETKNGCSGANHAHAVAKCHVAPPSDIRKYRTRAIYVIIWDNGQMTGPTDKDSPDLSINWFC